MIAMTTNRLIDYFLSHNVSIHAFLLVYTDEVVTLLEVGSPLLCLWFVNQIPQQHEFQFSGNRYSTSSS